MQTFRLLCATLLAGCSTPSIEVTRSAVESLGPALVDAPAIVMLNRSGHEASGIPILPDLHLFSRDSRGVFYEKNDRWWFDGPLGNDWTAIFRDLPSPSKLAATAWTDRMDLFATSGGQIFQLTYTNFWGPWTPVAAPGGPAAFISAPAVTSDRINHIDVVAWGIDRQLWHAALDVLPPSNTGGGAVWTPWEALGDANVGFPIQRPIPPPFGGLNDVTEIPPHGPVSPGKAADSTGALRFVAPDPALTAFTGAHHLDLFVRGSDNKLKHRARVDGVWQPWESLGGALTSDPAAAATGDGTMRVYVRNAARSISYRFWNGSWSDWQTIDGYFSSGPSATGSLFYPCDHLVARDAAGELWYQHCGERSSLALTSGGSFSDKGLLPWRTHVFSSGGDLRFLVGPTDVSLEARWPRELILVDTTYAFRDDDESVRRNAHWASLPGYVRDTSGLVFGPDFGPYLSAATFPFLPKEVRLVDHGGCASPQGWLGTYSGGKYRATGIFDQIWASASAKFAAKAASLGATGTMLDFTLDPEFIVDPFGDGFHLHLAYKFEKSGADVTVDVNKHYEITGRQGQLSVSTTNEGVEVDQNGWADFFEDIGAFDGVGFATILYDFVTLLPRNIENTAIALSSSTESVLWRCPSVGGGTPQYVADAACSDTRATMNFVLVPALETTMSHAQAIATADAWTASLHTESFYCYPDPGFDPTEDGFCRWHPYFERVNVLPNGIEAVWYNAEEPQTTDFKIVNLLQPSAVSGCAPTRSSTIDVTAKLFPSF